MSASPNQITSYCTSKPLIRSLGPPGNTRGLSSTSRSKKKRLPCADTHHRDVPRKPGVRGGTAEFARPAGVRESRLDDTGAARLRVQQVHDRPRGQTKRKRAMLLMKCCCCEKRTNCREPRLVGKGAGEGGRNHTDRSPLSHKH